MSEILTTCDKINELPNNTLAILRDTNDIPCFVLKDYNTRNLDNINVIHYSIPDSSEVFLLKLSNNKIYRFNGSFNPDLIKAGILILMKQIKISFQHYFPYLLLVFFYLLMSLMFTLLAKLL